MSTSHPFTESQRTRMQGWMDDIYGVFKGHVVAIRGSKLKKPIDELAGGRVYTGRQAARFGAGRPDRHAPRRHQGGGRAS